MVVVYILLGILGLITLLLYLPLRILIRYDEEEGLQYRVYYTFYCILDSRKESPETEEQTASDGKKKKEGESSLLRTLGLSDLASIVGVRKALKEKGLCQMLSETAAVVKSLLVTLGRFIGKGRFRRFDLQILVGDSDVGDAALTYGKVCAILYPMLDALKPVRKCGKRRIDVRCDFLREESLVRFDGQLHFRLWYVLWFWGALIRNYLIRSGEKS
jgi:hypothetical protein